LEIIITGSMKSINGTISTLRTVDISPKVSRAAVTTLTSAKKGQKVLLLSEMKKSVVFYSTTMLLLRLT
jgi:hypothetical protein